MKIGHEKPKNKFFIDFIMLPFGMFVNNQVQYLVKGDIITFTDGYSGKVIEVSKLSLESSMFDPMCQLRYGVDGEKVKAIWGRNLGNADLLGEYCLIIFFD